MDKLIKQLKCYLGKHKFGPYEEAKITYNNIPGKSQPVKAIIQIRDCTNCGCTDYGPRNGVWQ